MKILDIISDDLKEVSKSKKPNIGLSSQEAKQKLEKNGANTLESKKTISALEILINQFKDLLALILLASTLISVSMGEYVEAITISGIIFINAILGFFQELKTEKALQTLKNMAAPMAKVYRDGILKQIPNDFLVEGDIIIVEAGSKVPADAVLMESKGLLSDESIITGESVSIEKHVNKNAPESNKLNQEHIIYMGSIITQGRATAKVIATGMKTQIGNIANMLNEIEEEPTPLQKKLFELGKYLAIACLIICVIVFLAGIIRGIDAIDMLITGISLSVAAIPEGLPAIVTIALALSMKRMIKKKALIRKLHAVETLGCANVICSDKTGTLTENKMTVKCIATINNKIDVSGDGYQKSGDFSIDGRRINIKNYEIERKILNACVLCNNAEISSNQKAFEGRDRTANKAKGNWDTIGDPTEIALLVMSAKTGLTKEILETEFEKIDEDPFDSDKKYMSVTVRHKNGKKYLFVKGAYDIIIKRSTYIDSNNTTLTLDSSSKTKLSNLNDQMTNQALRVLGFAYKELNENEKHNNPENLTFLGLVGMIDPPRKEAKSAIKTCKKAGIKTVMITGDHKNTACAIAKQLGIYKDNDMVLTGAELEKISDDELTSKIKYISVFARVSPNHKVKIVRAFKRLGYIVAMTGDGVNDAPAMKEADIGVAMGINGTDVTKQVAEVILLNDNFATLINAVEEGRVIYSNIRKFIRYLLSCNIGEVVTMFLGILMGLPIVLLPIQILLVNLITDGLPAIALGMEPAEKDIMNKMPRKSTDGIFSNGLLTKIIFRGFLIGIMTLATFVSLFKYYQDINISRTGALLCLVFSQLIHVFECKDESKNILTIPYFSNIKLILSSLLSACIIIIVVYVENLQIIFKTVALNTEQLLIVMFFAFIPSVSEVVYDIIKKIFSKNISNKTLLQK